MSENDDPLEVIVQGGSIEANTVVYGVVQAALSSAAFTEVTVSSPQGDKAAHVDRIPSMLDVMRASRPGLFATPIALKQNVSLEDVGSFIADNPDQLDVGRIVYGIAEAGDDQPEVAAGVAAPARTSEQACEPEAVEEKV